jgi:hypothetical protein
MEISMDEMEPVWLYTAEENAITEITSLQLIIWQKGFSICGFSETGIPQEIKTFLFREDWDLEMMEQIFINDPLFAGPEPFTHVWLAEQRNILIPDHFYDVDYSGEWIRKFHFLESDEIIFTGSMAPFLEAQIVFPVREKLKTLLEHYMEEAKINALSGVALSEAKPANTSLIELINLPKVILLSLQHNGKFNLHQVSAYDNTEDIIYNIALILQEKDLNQDQVNIELSGIAPFWNNILEELPAYFNQIEIPADTTLITLNFFKKLYTCAS